jgi:hypothetical protein
MKITVPCGHVMTPVDSVPQKDCRSRKFIADFWRLSEVFRIKYENFEFQFNLLRLQP